MTVLSSPAMHTLALTCGGVIYLKASHQSGGHIVSTRATACGDGQIWPCISHRSVRGASTQRPSGRSCAVVWQQTRDVLKRLSSIAQSEPPKAIRSVQALAKASATASPVPSMHVIRPPAADPAIGKSELG